MSNEASNRSVTGQQRGYNKGGSEVNLKNSLLQGVPHFANNHLGTGYLMHDPLRLLRPIT